VELFLSATPFEAEFLAGRAEGSFRFRGRSGLTGSGWVWLELGVGKVNAAMTLAAFLEAHPEVSRILVLGLAGAYPASGLGLGELVLASEEIQADLGTERGLEPLGFPALSVRGRRYYNRFPAEAGFTAELAQKLGLKPLPFLTADKVSETITEAEARARRWRAAAENMEGAAVAQVALWRGLPWAELRAISNLAGVRERARWRVEDALDALKRAMVRLF